MLCTSLSAQLMDWDYKVISSFESMRDSIITLPSFPLCSLSGDDCKDSSNYVLIKYVGMMHEIQ